LTRGRAIGLVIDDAKFVLDVREPWIDAQDLMEQALGFLVILLVEGVHACSYSSSKLTAMFPPRAPASGLAHLEKFSILLAMCQEKDRTQSPRSGGNQLSAKTVYQRELQ